MPKISARKLILCELLHLNFKRKNNVRGKGYRCGKFLWKDTRKESFMFWLRNGNYLITSSSSSTLLLDILIFHSDASQSLFCLIICYIQQFHWLMILSNNSFRFGVDFFSTPKRKKKSITRKRNYCVFSTFRLHKVRYFPGHENISEVNSGLYRSKRKIVSLYE